MAGSAGLGLEPYMAYDHVVRVVQRVVYYNVEGRRREALKGGGGVECARQARIGRVGLGVRVRGRVRARVGPGLG